MKRYTFSSTAPHDVYDYYGRYYEETAEKWGVENCTVKGDWITVQGTNHFAYTSEAIQTIKKATLKAGYVCTRIKSVPVKETYFTEYPSSQWTWRSTKGDGLVRAGEGAGSFRSNDCAPVYYTTPEHMAEVKEKIRKEKNKEAEFYKGYFAQQWV